METFVKIIGAALIGLAAVLVIALFIGLPVMWLWNWLMPEIFGLKEVGFWQSVGLAFLCGILFKASVSKS